MVSKHLTFLLSLTINNSYFLAHKPILRQIEFYLKLKIDHINHKNTLVIFCTWNALFFLKLAVKKDPSCTLSLG